MTPKAGGDRVNETNPPIPTFIVKVYADGWIGQFELPETYFIELSSYLTERASK